MSVMTDLRVIYNMAFKRIRGQTHAERLESFYAGQAEDYDSFRKRLLPGRQQLWDDIPTPLDGVWVDMGGGTGSNVEYLGDRLSQLRKIYVVDLAPSLLQVAQQRVERQGWSNVVPVLGDATEFQPEESSVDVVTFSYSLTMIPAWDAAIDNALRILKPGGRIAVVDFFVSRKHVEDESTRHGWFTRTFWPTWFANDNVFLNADHLPYLRRRFRTESFRDGWSKVPYIPALRVPYYQFIGVKAEPSPPEPAG